MSKRTLILIGFLLLLTGFFIYLALSQKTPTQKKSMEKVMAPTVTPSQAFTTLSLTPANLTLSSKSGSVDIQIDTHGEENKVTAVQLELQYDPKAVTNVTIKPGEFLGEAVPLINTIDDKTGRISYALAIPPSGTGKAGSGTLATISFQSLLSVGSSTSLTVLPETLVTGEGIATSILKSSNDVTITAAGVSGAMMQKVPSPIVSSP